MSVMLKTIAMQFITQDNGRVSTTKIWSTIGCAVCTWIVIYQTVNDKLTWEFFITYLGSVGGLSQVSKWLAYKYGAAQAATPKEGE